MTAALLAFAEQMRSSCVARNKVVDPDADRVGDEHAYKKATSQ